MSVLHIKKQNVFLLLLLSIIFMISTFLWKQEHQEHLSPQSFGSTKEIPSTSILTEHDEEKVKGCFVILIRNNELEGIVSTMSQIEDTFNGKYDYPYVFLNNEEFTSEFRSTVNSLTNARVLFGIVEEEMWGYPDFINQTFAAEAREKMAEQGVAYATSESYRHMCRYQSGFFFKLPLLDEFDYYWRLEPYVDYYCQIDYDVFKFMKDNRKKYGFNIALKEHMNTIPTLWQTVMEFTARYPEIANKLPHPRDSLFDFVTSDGGRSYNSCHFWSNFEVGDLSLWRSNEYLALFDYLDQSGGFFYERWGDAPVHSIAAALLLRKEEFHFFNDIGYRHTSYTHCPIEEEFREKCSCDPAVNFDFDMDHSCYPLYQAAMGDNAATPKAII